MVKIHWVPVQETVALWSYIMPIDRYSHKYIYLWSAILRDDQVCGGKTILTMRDSLREMMQGKAPLSPMESTGNRMIPALKGEPHGSKEP